MMRDHADVFTRKYASTSAGRSRPPEAMAPRPLILLFDAMLPASSHPAALLRVAGFEVVEARDQRELEAFANPPVAAVVGGWMSPADTVRTVQQLRARGWRQPILIRGKLDTVDDCVAAMTAGASDFACCDPTLASRLLMLLRRSPPPESHAVHCGDITVDVRRRSVSVAGRVVRVSQLEADFLAVLARAEGRPVRRDELLREVWQCAGDARTRTIETHVWRLQKKLGDDAAAPRWLMSHPGVGYSLASEKPANARSDRGLRSDGSAGGG